MKKNRGLALILIFSLLFSMAVPAGAEEMPEYATRAYAVSEFIYSVGINRLSEEPDDLTDYQDVDEIESGEEYYALCVAVGNGIVTGYEDRTLRPNEFIKRVEALTLLARCLPETTDVREDIPFQDVPEWAKKDISRLAKAGLVNGYSSTELGAEDFLTVEQVGLLTERLDNLLNPYRPGDDFYHYANAKALRNVSLDEGMPCYSSMSALNDMVHARLYDMIAETVLKEEPESAAEQRIQNLFWNAYDIETRDALGVSPLEKQIKMIENASSISQYVDVLAVLRKEYGFSSLLVFTADVDWQDAEKAVYAFENADTGIDMEYFRDDDIPVLSAYQTYLYTLFTLADEKNPSLCVKDAYGIMEKLASTAVPTEEAEEQMFLTPSETRAEFLKRFSHSDISRYIQKSGQPDWDTIHVYAEKQIDTIESLLTERNLRALKNYTKAILYLDCAEFLTTAHMEATRDFERVLYGAVQEYPPEERAMQMVNNMLPWEIGQLYAEEYGSEEVKQDVLKMVDEILAVYRTRIQNQDWMSEATKETAIDKLNSLAVNVAYPDDLEDYMSDAQITTYEEGGNLIENVISLSRAYDEEERNHFHEPIDRTVFAAPPQTVNAFYMPSCHSINIPLGILDGVFYNPEANEAENLAGIGMVIGHEMTHAFDRSGSKYDKNGNRNSWWTEDEQKKFDEKVKRVVDFYNDYPMEDGRTVNGAQTASENIADLGGLSCVAQIAEEKGLPMEDFFRQYALLWMEVDMEEYLDLLLLLDTHSTAEIRVNAVLSNIESFYRTYDISPDCDMYVAPEHRVLIW